MAGIQIDATLALDTRKAQEQIQAIASKEIALDFNNTIAKAGSTLKLNSIAVELKPISAAQIGKEIGKAIELQSGSTQTKANFDCCQKNLEILRKIESNTAKAISFSGTLYQGFLENLTTKFSQGFLKSFEKRSGINTANLGGSLGSFAGIGGAIAKNFATVTSSFVGTGLNNLKTELGLDKLARNLESLITESLIDAADSSVTFSDLLKNSLSELTNNFQKIRPSIEETLGAAKQINSYLKSFQLARPKDGSVLQIPIVQELIKPIAKPLDETLKARRSQNLEKAFPLIFERAKEIYEQNIDEVGKLNQETIAKTLAEAEKLKNKKIKGVSVADLKIGKMAGVDAPKAVTKETEELFITIGGYAGHKQAASGLRIAGQIIKAAQELGRIDLAAIGIANPDTDLKPEAMGRAATKLQGMMASLAKPNLRGFSKDAVEAVAQAIAAIMVNPNLKVSFLGESGGGFVAEEATALAQKLGFGTNIRGAGFGTPNFVGGINPENFTKYLAVNRAETLGYETKNVYSPLGFADISDRFQRLSGATEHPIEGYIPLDVFQQFVFGRGGIESIPKTVGKEDIEQINQFIENIFQSPSIAVEEVRSALVSIQSQLKDVNVSPGIENEFKQIQSVLSNLLDDPELIKGFSSYKDLLLKAQDIARENFLKGSQEGIANVRRLFVDITNIQLRLIKQSLEVPEFLKNSFVKLANDFNKIKDGIDISNPKVARIEYIIGQAIKEIDEAYNVGNTQRLRTISRELSVLIKEITQDKQEKGNTRLQALKQELIELKQGVNRDLIALVRTAETSVEMALASPSEFLAIKAEQTALAIQSSLRNISNKFAQRALADTRLLAAKAILGMQSNYQRLKAGEDISLGRLPFGKEIKSGIQNVVFPTAAFMGLQGLPGVETAASAVTGLVQHGLLEPLLGFGGGAIGRLAGGALSSLPGSAETGMILSKVSELAGLVNQVLVRLPGVAGAEEAIAGLLPSVGNLVSEKVSADIVTLLGGRAALELGAAAVQKGVVRPALSAAESVEQMLLPGATVKQLPGQIGVQGEQQAIEADVERLKSVVRQLSEQTSLIRLLSRMPGEFGHQLGAVADIFVKRSIEEVKSAIDSLPASARMATLEGNQLSNLASQLSKLQKKINKVVESSYLPPASAKQSIELLGLSFKSQKEGLLSENPEFKQAFAQNIIQSAEQAKQSIVAATELLTQTATEQERKAIERISKAAINRVETALKAASVVNNEAVEVGRFLAQGLAQGIQSEIDLVNQAVADMSSSAIVVSKQTFEEKSPSQVFKRIGQFLGIGLAQGIKESSPAAENASQKMADKTIRRAKDVFSKVPDFLKSAASAFAGIIAFQIFDPSQFVFAIQSTVQAAAAFEALDTAIANTSKNSREAAFNLKFVSDAALQTKSDITTVKQGFIQLQAAAQGNENLKELVRPTTEALLQAGRTYNLSAEQLSRANTAIAQSFSKGQVMSEELKGQLSEALPATMQVAARSFGVTTAELNKMVEKGVTAEQFFGRFSRQLKAETAISARLAANTISASLTDLSNNFKLFQYNLTQAFKPVIAPVVAAMSAALYGLGQNAWAAQLAIKLIAAVIIGALLPGLKVLGVVAAKAFSLITGGAWQAQGAMKALAATVSKTLITMLALTAIVDVYGSITEAGKSAAIATDELNKSLQELERIRSEINNKPLNIADEIKANRQAFEDSQPVTTKILNGVSNLFVGYNKLNLIEALRSKEIAAQTDLIGANNKVLLEAQVLLERAAKGEKISAQEIDAATEAVIKSQISTKSMSFQRENDQKMANEQLNAIDELLPKLQEEADRANGITVNYGRLVIAREKALKGITQAELNAINQVDQLLIQGTVTAEAAEKQKLNAALTRIQRTLAEERKFRDALPKTGNGQTNPKLREEIKKSQEEITKLVNEEAQKRIEIRKAEQAEAIAAVDKAQTKATEAIIANETLRKIEVQQLINDGVIDAQTAEQEKIAVTQERIHAELTAEEELRDRLRSADIPQLTKEEKIRASQQKTNELTLSLLESEKQAETAVIDAIETKRARVFESRTKAFDLTNQAIDQYLKQLDAIESATKRIEALNQAQADLVKATLSASVARGDLEIERLNRAKELTAKLNSDDFKSAQEKLLITRQLNELGFNGKTKEYQISLLIEQAEKRRAQFKLQSLQQEQAIARTNLEIELRSSQLEAQKALIESGKQYIEGQKAILESQKQLSEAQANFRKESTTENAAAVATASVGLELSQQSLSLSSQAMILAQQQLNDQNGLADAKRRQLEIEQAIATEQLNQSEQLAKYNEANSRATLETQRQSKLLEEQKEVLKDKTETTKKGYQLYANNPNYDSKTGQLKIVPVGGGTPIPVDLSTEGVGGVKAVSVWEQLFSNTSEGQQFIKGNASAPVLTAPRPVTPVAISQKTPAENTLDKLTGLVNSIYQKIENLQPKTVNVNSSLTGTGATANDMKKFEKRILRGVGEALDAVAVF